MNTVAATTVVEQIALTAERLEHTAHRVALGHADQPAETRSVWPRLVRFTRDFLTLTAGLEVLLLPLATWGLDFDLSDPWKVAVVTAMASLLAVLGLFLTWGDGGSAVDNAVKGVFVVLFLGAGLIALFIWLSRTTGDIPGT